MYFMGKKAFFKDRTNAEIRDLHTQRAYSQRDLINKILNLDGSEDALEIRNMIIPGKFHINAKSSQDASRKCYKHGDLIALNQPQTQQEAYECRDIPLAIRARDFDELRKLNEEEINFIGYSFRPVQGRDRRKRIVPFVWVPESAKLFGYSENIIETNPRKKKGIEIKPYDDSAKVKTEGAKIIAKVPSRTAKKPRYIIRLENIPVEGNTERRAIPWGVKSDFEIDPEHSKYNMRYTWEHDREGSDIFTFYPHDIAAYFGVIKTFNEKHNLTPLEMNPFSIPSRKLAEFYKKLCNNVLVFDPTLLSKDKLRKPHLAEKSILIARAIGKLGHDETMFWDPERDGRLKDYDWGVE